MAKPDYIELGDGRTAVKIPIVYEDRAALIIDKPAGWMLAPVTWQRTGRNLQAALESSIAARDFWARSRNIRFLRFIHRLDAETSGLLLYVKSPGAVRPFSELFESRRVEKIYLAVVRGIPAEAEWTCRLKLATELNRAGKIMVTTHGREAETSFKVLRKRPDPRLGELSLVEARPKTGRTHQIRVHAAESTHAILGDTLYSNETASGSERFPLALRAAGLSYPDPFTGKLLRIKAQTDDFLADFDFEPSVADSGQPPSLDGGSKLPAKPQNKD